MEKSKKLVIGKLLLILLGIVVIILIRKYLPNILTLTVSVDSFRDYILSIGKLGPFALILFQVFQTVIAPIPGEIIQADGGYIYGVPLGTLYVTAGMLLGVGIAFFSPGLWVTLLLSGYCKRINFNGC